ncbi:hypothetical protein CEXT_128671 [Caerostris extrusa]|uniref:Uncharacterized protein n=1 Tax=Caerostris extrusa TaxID=172846 RepID=A0AAV4V5X9_CAEEX|nr:hypothetical protein CEXT_128671 [Caerostris extrusa]
MQQTDCFHGPASNISQRPLTPIKTATWPKLANQSVIPEPVRKAFFCPPDGARGSIKRCGFPETSRTIVQSISVSNSRADLEKSPVVAKKKKKKELVVCEKPHPECLQGMTSLWMTDRRPAFSEKPISLSVCSRQKRFLTAAAPSCVQRQQEKRKKKIPCNAMMIVYFRFAYLEIQSFSVDCEREDAV